MKNKKLLRADSISIGKSNDLGNWLVKILLSIIAVVSLYYLLVRGFPFLIMSEEIYGPYYFSRIVWIWPHVLGGIIAMALGPFQFIKKIRIEYLRFHRISGYLYLIGLLISAVTLIPLITTSSSNLEIDIGLGLGGFFWFVTAVYGFIAIKNGKVEQHREWMFRSYMITLAFVVFRIVVDAFSYYQVTNEAEIITIAAWTSWTLPCCITEMVIQGRKITK